MSVCMYVCMYVGMYVYIYIYTYLAVPIALYRNSESAASGYRPESVKFEPRALQMEVPLPLQRELPSILKGPHVASWQ